jgi:hypothetical protein
MAQLQPQKDLRQLMSLCRELIRDLPGREQLLFFQLINASGK